MSNMPSPSLIQLYTPNEASVLLEKFLALEWVQVDQVPRAEYYCNDLGLDYTYGKGQAARSYSPQVWTPEIRKVQEVVTETLGCVLDVVFLNRYDTSRHYLGWHADDSPEMDQNFPIVTVTFGHERPIETKNTTTGQVESFMLPHGSMFVMPAGFQSTHLHRIPKVGFEVKPRVSLTFRRWINPAEDSRNG